VSGGNFAGPLHQILAVGRDGNRVDSLRVNGGPADRLEAWVDTGYKVARPSIEFRNTTRSAARHRRRREPPLHSKGS